MCIRDRDRIGGSRRRERAIQICQKDEGLRQNSVLIEPIEAWTKVGSSASHRVKVNRLAGFVRLNVVDRRVEVQDMHTLRPLAFENRTHLGLSLIHI